MKDFDRDLAPELRILRAIDLADICLQDWKEYNYLAWDFSDQSGKYSQFFFFPCE